MSVKSGAGAARNIEVTERPEVPVLSILFGYGPMVPFAIGAVGVWFCPPVWRREVILLTAIWGSAILAFLAGVRRGLSFRTQGGPHLVQIATMFGLFVLALGALLTATHGLSVIAIASLLAGFAAIMLLDPIAARRGEAPLFFARLRPPQMMIAVASLAAMLAERCLH